MMRRQSLPLINVKWTVDHLQLTNAPMAVELERVILVLRRWRTCLLHHSRVHEVELDVAIEKDVQIRRCDPLHQLLSSRAY